jgi:hypothetical protein
MPSRSRLNGPALGDGPGSVNDPDSMNRPASLTNARTSRRSFLSWTGMIAAASAAVPSTLTSRMAGAAEDDGRPPVTAPRATSFDRRVQPAWDEQLTITVGPKDADLVGTSHRAVQAAVDYVANLGGGTVLLQPGDYVFRGSVHLKSGVRLRGSGLDTIITKIPSRQSKLVVDSDWYDQEITLAPGHGFQVGDSVLLQCINAHYKNPEVLKRTLTARSGDRFRLDKPLKENYWLMGESTAAALFPLVTGEEIEQVSIENLALDGDRKNNERLDGNYGGCIFLQDCRDIVIRDVTARNNHGDGISWQICHDVTVERCHSHDNADLGLHPGSGSQRPLIRHNRLENNGIGLFFCWGIKFGLAEHNKLNGNVTGISIGHRDTDNLIRHNVIRNSGTVGILFRPERGPTFCAHRNRLEANEIINSGGSTAAAIDVQGGTEEVTFERNLLREERGAEQRIAIRLGPETNHITLTDNQIDGFAQTVVQLAKS